MLYDVFIQTREYQHASNQHVSACSMVLYRRDETPGGMMTKYLTHNLERSCGGRVAPSFNPA